MVCTTAIGVGDVEHWVGGFSRLLQDCHALGGGTKMLMQRVVGSICLECPEWVEQHDVQILEICRSSWRGVGFLGQLLLAHV